MIRKIVFGLLLVGLTAVTQNAQAGHKNKTKVSKWLSRHGGSVTPLDALSFVGDGYVILDIAGAGDAFYNVNNSNDTTNPMFDTDNTSPLAFSQTFTINQGDSILLGGELQTFPGVTNPGTTAFLGYAVTDLTETGSFTELNLPFNTNVGNNDKWQQLASTAGAVEIGSSLAPGTYLLAVYQHGANGGVDTFTNEGGTGGNNWEAQIVVVPEPATILLVGPTLLAGLFYIRRRRA